MSTNPFSNIKATHLSKKEIVDFWVDIHNSEKDKENFEKIIEPKNPRPIIILGGKGSGKTHILRFFSYESQKVRAKEEEISIISQLQDEGYISILLELGDFQFQRFSGSKLDDDVWNEWFFYYLNLVLIEKFIRQVFELEKKQLISFDRNKISDMSSKYFFNSYEVLDSIKEISEAIFKEHKKIDQVFSKLRTGTITQLEGIEPIFDTRENRFFDISHDILKASKELKNLRILFLLDQFEDLSEEQQKFINTFIRHPKHTDTISFRLAGRLYAIKTEDTFSDSEKNLGAEVTKKKLEGFMGDYSSYKTFALELSEKRYSKIKNIQVDINSIENSFEKSNLSDFIFKIKNKYESSFDRPYIKKFRKKLLDYSNNLGINKENDIETIISNIICEDPLVEKKNIWLIYQAWSNNKPILKRSLEIKNSLSGEGTDIHKSTTLKHIENDLLFQLSRDCSVPYLNCGFENILKYSSANPRNYMNILNHLYEKAEFNGEPIFKKEKPVSCKTQDQAIKAASKDCWEDATSDIEDYRIIRAAERINSFFKRVRISDKLVEKNLTAFAYRGNLAKEAKYILDNAVKHSLLNIKPKAKKEKNNTGEMLDIYYVNAMLTINWELPMTYGGVEQFDAKEIDILCIGEDNSWERVVREYTNKLNTPFAKISSEPNLFGEEA